jgi:outer membrane lipoprotein SlyB
MARAASRLHRLVAVLASLLVATLAHAQATPATGECSDFPCGRVLTIKQTTVKNDWTPLGTTGQQPVGTQPDRVTTTFQFGRGMTNEGIVVLGAQGGAVYGKSPNSYEKPQWQVTVKLDSGRTRVLTVPYEPYVREGDRVRIAGNNVELVD